MSKDDDFLKFYKKLRGEKYKVYINAINFKKVMTIPGILKLNKVYENIEFEFEEGVIHNFSPWSIRLMNIISCKLSEENAIELLLDSSTNIETIDANAQKINSINYIVHIYSNEAEEIVKEINKELLKIKNKNKKRKQNITYENIYYDTIKKKYKTFLITGKFGRNIPKKITFTGFLYFNDISNNLTILFDSESERKNNELFCPNRNNEISIEYNDIINYTKNGNTINFKICCDNIIEKEALKFFGIPTDNSKIYEINIKSEKSLDIYNLLLKKTPLNYPDDNKMLYCGNYGAEVLEEDNQCPKCGLFFKEDNSGEIQYIKQQKKERKKDRTYMSGLLLVLYIIFYPIIFLVSLPFMVLNNFVSIFKEDTRDENEKTWDDWRNTKS